MWISVAMVRFPAVSRVAPSSLLLWFECLVRWPHHLMCRLAFSRAPGEAGTLGTGGSREGVLDRLTASSQENRKGP